MVDTYGAHECKVFYVVESTYGQTPSNPSMTGINVEEAEPSISPSLIEVRGVGTRDLIALKRGLWKPTLKLKTIPYSTLFLQNAVNLNSLSVQVVYYKGSFSSPTDIISLLYSGMRIDKVTVEGSVDDVVKADVELVGQNLTVSNSLIAGATYNEASGAVFSPQDVVIQRGTGAGGSPTNLERVTDWKVTVANNLKQVPVVRGTSSYLHKYLPARHRELSGELTFEFEDKAEFDDVINDSEFSLKFLFSGGLYYIIFTYCKWNEVKTPTKVEDLVSLKARFTARGVTMG